MRTVLSKTAPLGEFVEVSVLMRDWRNKFRILIRQNRRIQYYVGTMPAIPSDLKRALKRKGYIDIALDFDDARRFLIPDNSVKQNRKLDGLTSPHIKPRSRKKRAHLG